MNREARLERCSAVFPMHCPNVCTRYTLSFVVFDLFAHGDLETRKFETETRVTIRVTVLWAGSKTARNFSGLRTVPSRRTIRPHAPPYPPHPGARARGLPRPSALLASRSPPWTSASWKRCATTPVPSSSSVRPSVAASPVVVPSDTPPSDRDRSASRAPSGSRSLDRPTPTFASRRAV